MEMTAEVKKDRWHVLWAAQRSQRYHSRRSAFYARWNKATSFVSILAGSSFVLSIADHVPNWVGFVAAGVVVVMSGVDLVASTAEMAHKHIDLRRRFCELEKEITQELQPTEAKVSSWQAQRLAIEADEPPTYVALDLLCENELTRTYAHLIEKQPIKVPWYKVATAQILLWPNA